MAEIFGFGERVEGYDRPVLNEREVRAAAGILFASALVSVMHVALLGSFRGFRVFLIAFLIDFILRLLINPRYAPSLVLGRLAVGRQAPEWVGAPQKRFAWGIGLGLAAVLFYLMFIEEIVGPLNMVICVLCLLFLFFESAFGICLGCMLYNAFNREQARYCPGGTCETDRPALRPMGLAPLAVLVAFLAGMFMIAPALPGEAPGAHAAAEADVNRCEVPEFAKATGHEEMWKRHHNCP